MSQSASQFTFAIVVTCNAWNFVPSMLPSKLATTGRASGHACGRKQAVRNAKQTNTDNTHKPNRNHLKLAAHRTHPTGSPQPTKRLHWPSQSRLRLHRLLRLRRLHRLRRLLRSWVGGRGRRSFNLQLEPLPVCLANQPRLACHICPKAQPSLHRVGKKLLPPATRIYKWFGCRVTLSCVQSRHDMSTGAWLWTVHRVRTTPFIMYRSYAGLLLNQLAACLLRYLTELPQ